MTEIRFLERCLVTCLESNPNHALIFDRFRRVFVLIKNENGQTIEVATGITLHELIFSFKNPV